MQRKLVALAICLLAVAACRKKEEPAPAPAAQTATHTTAAPPMVTIPPQGLALWLIADYAQPGKLASWTSFVDGVTATAPNPEEWPDVVPNALNGHNVVRFDGQQNMLMTNIDIGVERMPEATIFAVFNSKTDAKEPLRKLYGNDNGGYDRAAGLDGRSEKNYNVFTGNGVTGYFDLKANENYVTADVYGSKDFTGFVNGKKVVDKTAAAWGDALPNLYIGNTGTVYQEHWQGDLAEIVVYARLLTDQERMQVEDYLGKKYGVTIAR